MDQFRNILLHRVYKCDWNVDCQCAIYIPNVPSHSSSYILRRWIYFWTLASLLTEESSPLNLMSLDFLSKFLSHSARTLKFLLMQFCFIFSIYHSTFNPCNHIFYFVYNQLQFRWFSESLTANLNSKFGISIFIFSQFYEKWIVVLLRFN